MEFETIETLTRAFLQADAKSYTIIVDIDHTKSMASSLSFVPSPTSKNEATVGLLTEVRI